VARGAARRRRGRGGELEAFGLAPLERRLAQPDTAAHHQLTLWIAAALLVVAGAADSVSAVCRSTINQTVTPDHMRGRMSSVFSLVVTSGPRLGDIELGVVAGAASARVSVASGGLACLVGVGLVMIAFPALKRYDSDDWIGQPAPSPA
jgi:MFS-type transporter involved in bile tolerance (Atg22 family)